MRRRCGVWPKISPAQSAGRWDEKGVVTPPVQVYDMTELLDTPQYDRFLSLCRSAERNIRLCAPFVKEEIIADIFSAKKQDVGIDLITNINLKNFYNGISDLAAIAQIVENAYGSVYNRSNLHAKFYIFDKNFCIITSANLTSSGMKRNFEYGIITDEQILVNKALKDYTLLAADTLTGKVSLHNIDIVKKILESIPETKKERFPDFDPEMPDNIYDKNKNAVTDNLKGWQKTVFNELNSLDVLSFSSETVQYLAEKLQQHYPRNFHREDKIRQVLQQLRDIGLVQFTAPGKYKKLWSQ
jgi:phosphatidylserine/phosphatidylglycerophosphate/cardiolipin synthase-like enzyme